MNIEEYKRKLEHLRDSGVNDIIIKATNEIAQRIFTLTVDNTPVDSGFLKNGWDIETEQDGLRYKVTIFNNVEYAIYVEYGHRKKNNKWHPGRFMFTLSKKEVQDNQMEKIIEKHLKQGLEGLK